MIRLYIPKSLKEGEALHVVQYIGRHGYTRSEYLKAGKWKPGDEFYVDNDSTKVEWVTGTIKIADTNVRGV